MIHHAAAVKYVARWEYECRPYLRRTLRFDAGVEQQGTREVRLQNITETIEMNRFWVVSLLVVFIGTGSIFGQELHSPVTNNSFPRIVAKVNLFNQTSAINSTKLWTPPKAGLFRLSGEISPSARSTWFLNASWTDGFGIQNWSSCESGCMTGGALQFLEVTVRANKGSPISYSTSCDGCTGSYNLFFVVEQLE